MVRILSSVLLALLLGAAAAPGQTPERERVAGEKQTTSKPAAESPPGKRFEPDYSSTEVSFQVPEREGESDKLELSATLYRPAELRKPKVPGVLLLHMLGADRSSWEPLIPDIVSAGYAVLAIDLRGHGESDGPGGRHHDNFTERDWRGLGLDVEKSQQFFAGREFVNGERIGLIGASIGANVALQRASASESVRTAVLLSPGLDYRGVTTRDAAVAYPEKSLFVMASKGDDYAARSARRIVELAENPHPEKLSLFQGDAHGTALFGQEKELSGLILNWLYNHLLF